MPPVAEMASPGRLVTLVTPANLRLGKLIRDEGGIELTTYGPQKVTARVGGVPSSPTRRTVVLESTNDKLGWSCTCTKSALFCKHCAAVALVAYEKAASRQT
jgi:uncharacterized Zn finger protein